MSSTFYGFEIAKTGLFASQSAIDLTSHNISNANTTGYTREVLTLSSRDIAVTGERFQQVTKGETGAGVNIDGVEQVRDAYLDKQYRRENGTLSMWSSRSDALGYVEQLFNETGDTGLSASINNFFSSLQTLTTDPESKEDRTNVLQNANEMTDAFQHLASQLADKQADQDESVNVAVTQINDTAQSIADLNDQIFRYELSGDKANDLRDQRNTLLDKLSGLTDITYSEDADGEVSVDIGGQALVNRTTVHKLQATQDMPNPIAGLGDLYNVTWSDYTEPDGVTPLPVTVSSGSLKAYMDVRDGDSDTNIGIPYLRSQLDELAAGITSAVNTVHSQGWTMPYDDGTSHTSATGVNFFTETNGVPVTAANFSVDNAIKTSVYNIACAGSQITSDSLNGDNTNVLALVDLQNKMDIPNIGSIEGFEKGFVSGLGEEAAHTNTMKSSEQTLVDSIDSQRQSTSGVSVDEELTNLVKYQHSYAASARVITAIDETLDTLINRMGTVGR
jgi:flagellar hook-associated protein 1 FlgK